MHFWKLLTFQVWKLRAGAKSIQNVRSEVIFQICYQHTDCVSSNKVATIKLSFSKIVSLGGIIASLLYLSGKVSMIMNY